MFRYISQSVIWSDLLTVTQVFVVVVVISLPDVLILKTSEPFWLSVRH